MNPARPLTLLGAVIGTALIGFTLAHASLRSANPDRNTVVKAMPKTVTLEFTEPFEVRFSSFKVYRLDTKASTISEAQNEAQALLDRVIGLKDDLNARADQGTNLSDGTAARIELKLRDKLEPGYYVVMWRVLSVDTHTTEDYLVFRYKP